MGVNLIDVGSIINIFLMIASIVFMLISFSHYTYESKKVVETSTYFDGLLMPAEINYLYLTGYSSMLLFISVYGYMSLTENRCSMIVIEMILLLLMIAIEVYAIYSLYAQKENMNLNLANNIYKGIVLPMKTSSNESKKALEMTYKDIIKWKRCCGIYSWKDAESFRPIDCCRRGYVGDDGKGTCNENYGPYADNCIEVHSIIVQMEINKYALVITGLVLTEFLGLMLCGLVFFIQMDNEREALAIVIRNMLLDFGQRLSRGNAIKRVTRSS